MQVKGFELECVSLIIELGLTVDIPRRIEYSSFDNKRVLWNINSLSRE